LCPCTPNPSGFAAEFFPVENNLAAKVGVGMRRAGKTDPAFIAQLRGKARVDPQVPGDVMTVRTKIAPAAALFNATFRGAAMGREHVPACSIQPVNGDFHDETLRCCAEGNQVAQT